MTALRLMPGADDDVPVSPPVFRAGTRVFSLDDILAATELRGEWAAFRADREQRLAAALAAEAAGLAPEPAAIEEATTAFRYARDLVSADECERWLTQRGLAFTDLTACVTRRLQAELAGREGGLSSPHSAAGLEPVEAEVEGQRTEAALDEGDATEAADWNVRAPGRPPDSDALLRTEAILADEFTGWARQFAWRLALACADGAVPPAEAGLAEAWPGLEARFAAARAALAEPKRRLRELAAQRLQLLRVELVVAEFTDVAAAREAYLCVREDGSTLAEVAAANGFTARPTEAFLGDVAADWQTALLSATPGEVLPPLAGTEDADCAVVLQLLSRREPSLDDADVTEQLDRAVRRQHFGELEARHIRWLMNVEVEA